MMPAIQFCPSPNGCRIAYTAHGHGPPLVCAAWWVSHLEEDWRDDRFRRFFEALSAHRTVIRYDRSGVGLSDRDRPRFDFASELADLEAVVDHLELERFALLGTSCGGPPSIAYAAANPERVSDLLLYGSFACGTDIGTEPIRQAVLELVRAHWGLGSRALGDLFATDLPSTRMRSFARRQRASADADTAARLLSLTYAMDVSAATARVRSPSVVIHRRGDRTVPFECGRALAGLLSGARLVPLEGDSHLPWEGDADEVLRVLLEALGDPGAAATAEPEDPALASIHREGDVWALVYEGRRAYVRHRKGIADLARLLSSPHVEIHASDLAHGPSADRRPRHPAGEPILDAQARSEIRRRAEDLREELTEAEAHQDLGQIDRLQRERELLLGELRTATALGGRDRTMPDAGERARKAVSARIQDGIRKIAEAHPELAEHLRRNVRTGIYCSYVPHPTIDWLT